MVAAYMLNKLTYGLTTVSLVCFILLAPSSSLATDNNAVNATITYGADDNPHYLSDSFKPAEPVYFKKGEFKLRTNLFKLLYVHARVNKSLFDDDPRADEFSGTAKLTLRDRFKLAGSKFKYKVSANYRFKDQTYVNKRTGMVGVFAGESIADRYDSDQQNYFAELIYLPTRYFEYGASYEQRDKSYKELNIPGLSNLDYKHQKFTAGFEYKASELGRFFMNGTFKQREYVDRRGKNLEGNNVLGTNLFYNYSTLNMGYIYRPNDDVRWRYTYNYEERRDTVSGYYNATSGYLAMSAIHRISDYQYLRARVKYSKFSLVNQIEVDPSTFEDDAKEKQGVTAMLGYEWILATLYDTNLAVYIELEHSNFANSDPVYTHQKSSAALGIRWSAF